MNHEMNEENLCEKWGLVIILISRVAYDWVLSAAGNWSDN